MESLTGGSSFFGVADGSLGVVSFTFGAAFSPVFEGLTVLRRRGCRTSLGSALAGGTFGGLPKQLSSGVGPGSRCQVPGESWGPLRRPLVVLEWLTFLCSVELLVLPMDLMRLAAGSSWSWAMDLLWRLADLCLGSSSGSGAVVGGMKLEKV